MEGHREKIKTLYEENLKVYDANMELSSKLKRAKDNLDTVELKLKRKEVELSTMLKLAMKTGQTLGKTAIMFHNIPRRETVELETAEKMLIRARKTMQKLGQQLSSANAKKEESL